MFIDLFSCLHHKSKISLVNFIVLNLKQLYGTHKLFYCLCFYHLAFAEVLALLRKRTGAKCRCIYSVCQQDGAAGIKCKTITNTRQGSLYSGNLFTSVKFGLCFSHFQTTWSFFRRKDSTQSLLYGDLFIVFM